jgi:hypothetical protein
MAQPEKVKESSMQGLQEALSRIRLIKGQGAPDVLILCAGLFDSARQSLRQPHKLWRVMGWTVLEFR